MKNRIFAIPQWKKQKVIAIALAIMFSFWTWLYSYRRDAWKFWLAIGLHLTIIITDRLIQIDDLILSLGFKILPVITSLIGHKVFFWSLFTKSYNFIAYFLNILPFSVLPIFPFTTLPIFILIMWPITGIIWLLLLQFKIFGINDILVMILIAIWLWTMLDVCFKSKRWYLSELEGRNKKTALVLAIMFGLFAWLYTYRKNALKFWISIGAIFAFLPLSYLFFVLLGRLIFGVGEPALYLFFLWVIMGGTLIVLSMWLWPMVDALLKKKEWYEQYK